MSLVARILFADRLRQCAIGTAAMTNVIAPWLFGGTRAWAVDGLTGLLAMVGLLWIVAACLDPRAISLSPWLPGFAIGLIILSAVTTALRPVFPDDPFMTEQLRVLRETMPGSFVAREPWRTWRFSSSVLLASMALADLLRDRRRWETMFNATVVAGASIAMLGLTQIAAGAPAMLWDMATPFTGDFFGPFFHYPPAGAYLNLTWPLALAAALGGWLQGFHHRGAKTAVCWYFAIAALGATALGCQGARAAHALGFLAMIILATLAVGKSRQFFRIPWLLPVGVLAGSVALFFAVAQAPLFEKSRARWQTLLETAPEAPAPTPVVWDSTGRGDRLIDSDSPTRGQWLWDRRLAWETAGKMIAARPWLGFGQGGWTPAYHHFTKDPFLKTFFLYLQFTHQGFLQILVEWGLIGGVTLFALALFAISRGIVLAFKSGDDPLIQFKLFGMILALWTLGAHACVDFPLEIPSIQLQAATLLALLWSSTSAPRPEFPGRPRRMP